MERNDTINAIKAALKQRSGRSWSVTGGTGTTWGWIRIAAPPHRCTWHYRETPLTDAHGLPVYEEYDDATSPGHIGPSDRAELARLLGLETCHNHGVDIPAHADYYAEYVARAAGQRPTTFGAPYWD